METELQSFDCMRSDQFVFQSNKFDSDVEARQNEKEKELFYRLGSFKFY
jgi:hypothetical protein